MRLELLGHEAAVSQHVHFQQAPPRSWDQFEELCADTFQEEWQDSTLVRHGRAGQPQQGVDIVGSDGAIWPVGIQCKRKSIWPVSKLTTTDLDKEVEKAKKFEPRLKAFYLVSTAPDDEKLLKHARLISKRHRKQGLFSVSVLGWGEVVRRATRHQAVANKHFGSYSSGPASPLLAIWRASGRKLLLDDRELNISIRELIHDLRDYPAGRVVFRQKESETLLLRIKQLQAGDKHSLSEREGVLDLRDKLKLERDMEAIVIAGLMLMFGHKQFRDYVRIVWQDDAHLLVRSFVEQSIDPELSNVTGLEKIRLHPPGYGDDPLAVFVPPADIGRIWKHRLKLNKKYPKLATDTLTELPTKIQFRHVVPAIIRKVVYMMEDGVPLGEIERRNWLDLSAWKFTA